MSAPRFLFTREAIRSWQKLPAEVQARLKAALPTLEVRGTHIKKLENSDRYRRRVGSYRILWRPGDGENERYILRVAWRDENTYRLPPSDFADHELLELATEADEETLVEAEKIAYRLEGLPSQTGDDEWRAFLYGGYRWTPRLSPMQRDCLKSYFLDWVGSDCPIIQCGPGSGKTLCAVQAVEEYLRQGRAANNHRYAALLVPLSLSNYLSQHPWVKDIGTGKHFFLGTFDHWLCDRVPGLMSRTISESEELDALKALVEEGETLTREDLVYFQARMAGELDDEWRPHVNKRKEPTIGGDNSLRRQRINNVGVAAFRRQVAKATGNGRQSGRLTRAEVPRHAFEQGVQAPPFKEILLIVDEAQERLFAELVLLKKVAERWQHGGCVVRLILLGDLNQRIAPTGYEWGHLGRFGYRTVPDCFTENYRNSRAVLTFAGRLWKELDSSSADCRALPKPAPPECAVDREGVVRRLVYDSYARALSFLEKANALCASGADGDYIRRKLANQIPVFCQDGLARSTYPNLQLLPARETKGREFGSAVVFCLFREQEAWSQRLFEWYTLVTRAESHLLLVMTADEEKQLANCQYLDLSQIPRLALSDEEKAIDEVRAAASEADLKALGQDLIDRLLEACRAGRPYLDTYDALSECSAGAVEEFETKAAEVMRAWDRGRVEAALGHVREVAMRCLILRAAGRSWDSAAAAAAPGVQDKEARRLVLAAAEQLETKNLAIEAARLRFHFASDEWPSEYEARGLTPGRPEEGLNALLGRMFFAERKRGRGAR